MYMYVDYKSWYVEYIFLFGRLHVYICMWILKIGRLNTLIFGRLYVYICMWIF